MKRIAALLAVLLFGSLQIVRAGAGPAAGQDVKDRFPLQHKTAVSLKLIQVIVTDKKGDPITDLGKEDFIVSDNGEEKKITEFEKHSLSMPASETPAAERSETPPSQPPSPLLGRKFFLLFDAVFVDVKGFLIARDAALRFIENDLQPEDEVAVISFPGGRSLSVHQFLTKDHTTALAAVEALSPGNLNNLNWRMGVRRGDMGDEQAGYIDEFLATNSAILAEQAAAVYTSPGARIYTWNFIWAMRSLAQATRHMPGKKHLILYTNGSTARLNQEYMKLFEELAASNIAVYPIYTADIRSGLVPRGPWKDAQTGVPSLREMASSTGGRYLGAADHTVMEKVNTLTGAYYVLGYPIGETWDGEFHEVRVKVRRAGAQVYAQPGYFNPKPFSDYSALEKEIDLVDLALADWPISQEPLRFTMRALPGAGAPPGNLHFIAEVSRAGLKDVAGKRVEAVSIVFDTLDKIIHLKRTELDLTPEALRKDRAFLFAALSAAPGTYKCRFVLRNMKTGRAAVAGSNVAVPDRKPGQVVIFPPLFVVASARGLYLGGEVVQDGQGTPSPVPPVLDQVAGALLFDPQKFSPYLQGPFPSPGSVFASLQCASADGNTSGLALSASLAEESSGKESPVPLTILEEKDGKGTKTFFVRFDVPEVKGGAYVLALVAADRLGAPSAAPVTYKCRLVLRDMDTGPAPVAGSKVAVPERKPGQVVVFPPSFVVSSAETPSRDAEAGKDVQGTRSRVLDQVAGTLLFDPEKFSPYLGGPLQSPCSIFASLQCASENGDTPGLALSASLTEESAGTESPIPITILAEKEGKGARAFFMRLDIPKIGRGAHVLTLVATDRASGLLHRFNQALSIE